MFGYEQIEDEAAELARQFWNEIETELTLQSTSQNYATPVSWQGGADLIGRIGALDVSLVLNSVYPASGD